MLFEELTPHECRSYLIGDEDSNEVVIVDPLIEHLDEYRQLLADNHYKLTHVIDTHTHADHISGAATLKKETGCEYVMSKLAPAQCVTIRLDDNQELQLGKVKIKAMYTPGHTADAMCIVLPDKILTGDALFLDDGGAGRDDLPGGDPGAHWESLQKLMQLPDSLIVYPGHEYRGRKPSSMGNQKKTNPHLSLRSKQEFINYILDLKLGPADWMKDVLKANYACSEDPQAAWIPHDVPACEVQGTIDKNLEGITVKEISVTALHDSLQNNNHHILLDVREKEELSEELGHIQGIVHLPVSDVAKKIGQVVDNKDADIVTVCRSGARAHIVAKILTKEGFNNVRVMKGGMLAWNEAGYKVEK